ncbi:MAG: sigma 54-interacting transcriptional regulator [Myxococcota bacterium]
MLTTLGDTREETVHGDAATPRRPGGLQLLVAWCREDPSRVGEVFDVLPGSSCVIGRSSGPDTASLVQRRPGRDEPRPPLTETRLSKRHLELRAVGQQWIEITRHGRNSVIVDGQALAADGSCRVTEGSLLKLANTLLLYVSLRETPSGEGDHAFGEPDEHGIVGECEATWTLRRNLAFVAARRGHVLIRGESGTGKELAARALHHGSSRRQGPFVSRNAATVPETLIDAEVFGNVRNYPNPGMSDRPGLVGAADGGTLFLDEVGELPEALQTHLLRVMDRGEYQRLGESRVRVADLRVVGATNRPLTDLRGDLQARFALKVNLPPLRERPAAIPLILRHIARLRAHEDRELGQRIHDERGEPRIACDFVEALMRNALPANVREVEGLFWEAVAATEPGEPLDSPKKAPPAPSEPASPTRHPSDITETELRETLSINGGNREATWRALRLRSRYQLRRLMQRYGLQDV